MTCPHCGVPLIDHADVNTKGGDAYHCNTCGCCFDPTGAVRPGHPDCGKPAVHPFAPQVKAKAEPAPEPEAEPETDDPPAKGKKAA